MDAIFWEWLSFFVRWTHVMAGIAWIGSSFYFVHLDQSLKQRPSLPDKAYGDEWQVHGGGFYHMVKYLVAPPQLPEHVTWFKWEAYATWLSGAALLVIVYYLGARLYLIDPGVMDIHPITAVAYSLGGIFLGWFIYNEMCESDLAKSDLRLALSAFAMIVAFALIYSFVFSGRGAFMQVGVIMGTIMAANVFFVIIPNQRKVVASLKAGEAPDPTLGQKGKQRSLHNNYLTLPVVFVMIGNHYPLAFATRFSWLILALVIVMGVSIRHFYNTRHRGLPSPWWTWGITAACGLAIMWLSSMGPAPVRAAVAEIERTELAEAAEGVVQTRCSMCHAEKPLWPGVGAAPKGVKLETLEELAQHGGGVRVAAILTHSMPPGNITEITPDERETLDRWLTGAR
ncbi:urate hydroxylase PuuD [Methylopila sp. M107]|uniref:urate hydroxylase PuuD n=1 Tax=Methylopila sp. M107 TaxID=1101190 RepID=UPI00035C13A9|nr:urate hydroxylase PuuD [Methylopila sp. M107]